MNDPHTHPKNPEQDDDAQFVKLGDYVESIWTSEELSATEKADLIRTAALRLLSGENEAEPTAPHTGGINDSRTFESLESDAMLLLGIQPSRSTSGRGREADAIESAIQRREAKHLMSRHDAGYHQ
jgi:hypothetical protein